MKQSMMLVMLILFLGTMIGANIYLAKRFAFFFGFESAGMFYFLFAGITLFMIGGVMGATNSVSTSGHYIFMVAAVTMGFFLYLVLSTVLIDLASLLIKTRPLYYGLIAISLAGLVSIYGILNATNLKLTEIDISIKGITNSIRVAHLTDTHLGHFRGGENLQNIVDVINQQKVDVVFFTGDLLDGKIQLRKESMDPFANLDAPIYFVEGNHDAYTGVDAIKNYLRSIGVNVLENEVTHFGELQIIGLTFMLADDESTSPHASPNGTNIKKVLSKLNINREKPTVLLHHGPDGVNMPMKPGLTSIWPDIPMPDNYGQRHMLQNLCSNTTKGYTITRTPKFM